MAKRKRRTAAQTIRKLEDADQRLTAGQSIAQVCQALEVSEATYHRWQNQYGGMNAEEAKRFKEPEVENTRLKKMGSVHNYLRGSLRCYENRHP